MNMKKAKLSILIPSCNTLPFLKLSLNQFRKSKNVKNGKIKLLIHVDGSTDGTIEWLEEEGFNFSHESWKGAYHSFNVLWKRAKTEYITIMADDCIVCNDWDKALLREIENFPDALLYPLFISAKFGKDPETFMLENFLQYADGIKEKRLMRGIGGFLTAKRELMIELDGYDEFYDPYGLGDRDFYYRLFTKYPLLNSFRIYDFILYHLGSGAKRKIKKKIPWETMLEDKQVDYFMAKNGISPGDEDKGLKGWNQLSMGWSGGYWFTEERRLQIADKVK